MDNAISALKIAAAMLFAILILSCLMYVRKSLKKIPEIEQERRRKAEIQEFNNMFFSYDKGQMYGTDVISCMNLVYNNNIKNGFWARIPGADFISDGSEKLVTMKIKLKKPLENIIQIYTYDENIKGEVPAVEGKIVTQDTYETILPKKIKKVFETLNKMFDIGIVVSQKIAPNSIKSEISNILLDKSRPKDEKIEAIIKFSNILSYKIFNKNYDAKKNNWYRLVWKTPIEDMKKRHFKCSDIRTNSKGRVEYILFEEI